MSRDYDPQSVINQVELDLEREQRQMKKRKGKKERDYLYETKKKLEKKHTASRDKRKLSYEIYH